MLDVNLLQWIGGFVGTAGGVGLLAYIARPTRDTIKELRADLDELKAKVEKLEQTNRGLFTAYVNLRVQWNMWRARLAQMTPPLEMPSIREILDGQPDPLHSQPEAAAESTA